MAANRRSEVEAVIPLLIFKFGGKINHSYSCVSSGCVKPTPLPTAEKKHTETPRWFATTCFGTATSRRSGASSVLFERALAAPLANDSPFTFPCREDLRPNACPESPVRLRLQSRGLLPATRRVASHPHTRTAAARRSIGG